MSNIIKAKYIDADLQDMLHSLFQDLFAPGPWRCSETQDLWQWTFSFQFFLHIASHYLVVDRLLVGVVTLINYQ